MVNKGEIGALLHWIKFFLMYLSATGDYNKSELTAIINYISRKLSEIETGQILT